MTFISAMQMTRSMSANGWRNASITGALGTPPCDVFIGEGGRLFDFAPDDVARDQDDDAEQERHAPSPRQEGSGDKA